MAEDQNLNVPGVDHRSQGNNDEGMNSVAILSLGLSPGVFPIHLLVAVGVSSSSSFPHSSSSISTLFFLQGDTSSCFLHLYPPFNTLSGRYSWRVREVLGFCSYSSIESRYSSISVFFLWISNGRTGSLLLFFFFPFSALLLHSTWLATVLQSFFPRRKCLPD